LKTSFILINKRESHISHLIGLKNPQCTLFHNERFVYRTAAARPAAARTAKPIPVSRAPAALLLVDLGAPAVGTVELPVFPVWTAALLLLLQVGMILVREVMEHSVAMEEISAELLVYQARSSEV
jgi:hypothetical protein